MKNVTSSIPNSNDGTRALSQDNTYLGMQQKCFIGTFHFITWNIKKMCTQALGFNKSTASSGTF